MILILFGGALLSGILEPLTWEMVFFTLTFVLIIRPDAAFVSLLGSKIHTKEKLAISFFGIKRDRVNFLSGICFSERLFR